MTHGRNDPSNKGETTHPKNKGETTQGETTHGRNDPRAKRPGFMSKTPWKKKPDMTFESSRTGFDIS